MTYSQVSKGGLSYLLSEKNGVHRMDSIGPRYASSNCPELGDKLNWDQLTGGAFAKLSMKVQTDPG